MRNREFENHYEKIWGKRWPALGESLMNPMKSIPYEKNLKKPYMMDHASVIAAARLKLPEEGLILDACAAPGGKSLVLASNMGANIELLSNELSSERRRRLVNVLNEHLFEEQRKRVRVSGFDTGKAGGRKSEHERFDAILLDVPCSSERHVMQSDKALDEWSPKRPQFLANRQWSLLSAAFLLLKPGGNLVYATCAINPLENDTPIKRLLAKYKDQAEIIRDSSSNCESSSIGEETEFGSIILPDRADGMGPMYFSLILKNP